MRTRLLIGSAGTAFAAYGVWLLFSRQRLDQLVSATFWLAGGVVAHDALLAPLSIVAVWLGARLLPAGVRRPAAVGGLVLGSLTVVALPVLIAAGRRDDNPTLLDRDYLAGWLVVTAIVLVAALVGAAVGSYRSRAGRSHAGRGGRVVPRPRR
jgi:hypothetical protein